MPTISRYENHKGKGFYNLIKNFKENMKAISSLPIIIFILSSLGPSEECWFSSSPPKPILHTFKIRNAFGLGGATGNVSWTPNSVGCMNPITSYGVGDSILYTVINEPCPDATLESVTAKVYYGNDNPYDKPPVFCKSYICSYPNCAGSSLPTLCIQNNTIGNGCEVVDSKDSTSQFC